MPLCVCVCVWSFMRPDPFFITWPMSDSQLCVCTDAFLCLNVYEIFWLERKFVCLPACARVCVFVSVRESLTSLLPARCLKAKLRGSEASALVVDIIMASPSGPASHAVSLTIYVHFSSNSASVHCVMSASSMSTSLSVIVPAPPEPVLVAEEAILAPWRASSCSMVCAPSLVNMAELWEVAWTGKARAKKVISDHFYLNISTNESSASEK